MVEGKEVPSVHNRLFERGSYYIFLEVFLLSRALNVNLCPILSSQE